MTQHLFRFYTQPHSNDSSGYIWELLPAEHHHLRNVLRMKKGEKVEVFDSNGFSAIGIVLDSSKSKTIVKSEDSTPPSISKLPNLHLIVSALKPSIIEEVIPPAVELGVNSIKVFICEGGNKSAFGVKTLERMGRINISACKQAKRDTPIKIEVCHSIKEGVEELDFDGKNKFFVMSPDGGTPLQMVDDRKSSENIYILVGSEKGLSPSELSIASDFGFVEVKLSNHILRSKTAIISAASVFSALYL